MRELLGVTVTVVVPSSVAIKEIKDFSSPEDNAPLTDDAVKKVFSHRAVRSASLFDRGNLLGEFVR